MVKYFIVLGYKKENDVYTTGNSSSSCSGVVIVHSWIGHAILCVSLKP